MTTALEVKAPVAMSLFIRSKQILILSLSLLSLQLVGSHQHQHLKKLSHSELGTNGTHQQSLPITITSQSPPFVVLTTLFTCCARESNQSESGCHGLIERSSSSWLAHPALMSNNASAEFKLSPVSTNPFFHNCNSEHFLHEISPGSLYPNGYLRVELDYYAPDEYCLQSMPASPEQETVTFTLAKICPPACSISRPCIPKCCDLNKIYSPGLTTRRGCIPSNSFFNPPLYSSFTSKLPSKGVNDPLPHFILRKPRDFVTNCPDNSATIFPLSSKVASLLGRSINATMHAMSFRFRSPDGAFLLRDLIDKKCRVQKDLNNDICFDRITDWGGDFVEMNEDEMMVYLCSGWLVHGHVQGHQTKHHTLYGILFLGVSIFPLITSLVYLLLWRKQNVHGWTIAATMGSMFLMYVLQGVALLMTGIYTKEQLDEEEPMVACFATAVIGHFSFLSAFSWMTVMCFDLWWTFRSLTPRNNRCRSSQGRSRYLKYSLFGWGFPFLFVTIGIILDYVYYLDDCIPHTVPGYGQYNCFVNPTSQGFYVYYPVAVLLSLNLLLFLWTAAKLLSYRKNRRIATKRDTDHWQGFVRFTKLFLVMGVSWVSEVINWSIHGLDPRLYWIIFDLINIFRAVGVFIVYVCKQDILVMLEDSHPCLTKILRPFKRRCSAAVMESTESTGFPMVIRAEEADAVQLQ